MIAVDSRRLAAKYQITGPQLMCLRTIANRVDMTANQLAKQIHLSPSTVVGILDRLEDKHLIRRQRSTADRRRVLINATKDGRIFAEEVPNALQQDLKKALSQWSHTEQTTMVNHFEQLVDAMRRENAHSRHNENGGGNDGDGSDNGDGSANDDGS